MTDANEALRKLVILAKSGAATDFEVNELARTVRAHLTDPGYVRVPVDPTDAKLDAILRCANENLVPMRSTETARQMYFAATKETSHD